MNSYEGILFHVDVMQHTVLFEGWAYSKIISGHTSRVSSTGLVLLCGLDITERDNGQVGQT